MNIRNCGYQFAASISRPVLARRHLWLYVKMLISLSFLGYLLTPVFATSFLSLEDERAGIFRVHGRFCGPAHPRIGPVSDREYIRILNSIEPVDALDLLCKEHDICYSTTFFANKMCDADFIRKTRTLVISYRNIAPGASYRSFMKTKLSMARAILIANYFDYIHPSKMASAESQLSVNITTLQP